MINDNNKIKYISIGDDCQDDYNGCSDTPCDFGRTCIDLSSAEHIMLNRPYNCSDCPEGYANNDTKCEGAFTTIKKLF